ncbi:hypothetical protein BT63DRAFT_419825 [Microthyrium microscopicum]|uniref:Actin cytoskeleton-regulatory complex protein SLA1 n=1 Tax=Microthyrium microscopicum TaxID=703497 RepID=A0A6A6UT00_9PEZI|nr:hypothetical protein BT63DRAFT_419825 [Microthyrium microscopicum]
MVFIGVYRAVYDYAPQDDNELTVKDGDLLCIVEKGDDGWWKVKKKAQSDEEDEPEGLVPENYLEETKAIGKARALYEYTRQTDEELSFAEDAVLEVFDTSDEDWTLVGVRGEYGFVPANYIELEEAPPPMPTRPRAVSDARPAPESQRAPLTIRAPSPSPPESPMQSVTSPAAALAGIIGARANGSSSASRRNPSPPREPLPPRKHVQFSPEESDEEAPAPRLPRRPTGPAEPSSPAIPSIPAVSRESRPSKHVTIREPMSPASSEGVLPSPPHNRAVSMGFDDNRAMSRGGFRLYNIYEIVEALGRSRKTPITLGIDLAKGVIMISSGESKESKEWSADKLTNYSIEGKHVFMELIRPTKSVDFHAGAKETAQEIVSALGELAGAVKAEGLRDIFATGPGAQKLGKILYDFKANASDEVSVKTDEEVIVLDDTKSEDWWLVKRSKNGKEGMVPSSYVEVTGTITTAQTAGRSASSSNGKSSFVEQNRLEEQRLAREASRKDEVGPGYKLPERGSSLSDMPPSRKDTNSKSSSKRSMPDSRKVRTWTDKSGTFKVEAEFIGLKDSKIHLHKINGVKIAVPVQKMSPVDLDYVEKATGQSLDDERSLADVKRKRSQKDPGAGASVEKKPDYDWFDFFLQCGVNYQVCERYAQAFKRDEMGEENMPDVTPELLRKLGIKEGDILRVMKYLDSKYGRTRAAASPSDATGAAGLFTKEGGALRNNRRPTPSNPARDTVDADALKPKTGEASQSPASASTPGEPSQKKLVDGFEDNAWEVRGAKAAPPPVSASAQVPAPVASPPVSNALTELSGLSLDTPPMQPTPAPQPAPVQQEQSSPAAQPTQPPGATPSLFEQLAKSPANQQSLNPPRQRPLAPMQTNSNSLMTPPPMRAASAPQNQQSAFQPPPLQAQLTGYPGQMMQNQMSPQGPNLQQQGYQQQGLMPQATGFQPQMTGFNPMQNGMMPQQTGYPQFQQQGMQYGQFQQPQQTGFQPQFQQQLMNGQQNGSPFADPPVAAYQPLQPQATGINAFLPSPLMPQRTGAPPVNFGPGNLPPVPPIPQSAPAPLVPQRTGPPPPVRFGVNPAVKRLAPQPTGKRANLSSATPDNPFGFQ